MYRHTIKRECRTGDELFTAVDGHMASFGGDVYCYCCCMYAKPASGRTLAPKPIRQYAMFSVRLGLSYRNIGVIMTCYALRKHTTTIAEEARNSHVR